MEKGVTPTPGRCAATDEQAVQRRVFKITSEGQLGEVFWLRVYSGSLKAGDTCSTRALAAAEKVSACW